MKLKILGTSAAEGWPGLFCDCDVCAKARDLGGRDLRTRCAYLIGRCVLIDFGPDIYSQCVREGVCPGQVSDLLVTHSHQDHFCVTELNMRREGFWRQSAPMVMRVHGNAAVGAAIAGALPDLESLRLEFLELARFVPIDLPEDLVAIPVATNHGAPAEEAVNFLLRYGGRYLLVGNDTDWYPETTWEFLAGRLLDVVIMDSTYGAGPVGGNHLGIDGVLSVKARLAELGCLGKYSRFIASHFSHNGLLLHEELTERYQPDGVEVAYDGMELEW